MGVVITYVNDVMVIPDIDHWNLRIRHAKQTLREPHRISIEVELLQLILQLLRKGCAMLLQRVSALSLLRRTDIVRILCLLSVCVGI